MFGTIVLFAALRASLAARSQAADRKVSITGASPAQGQFLVSVFDRSETCMKTPLASKYPAQLAGILDEPQRNGPRVRETTVRFNSRN